MCSCHWICHTSQVDALITTILVGSVPPSKNGAPIYLQRNSALTSGTVEESFTRHGGTPTQHVAAH